MYSRAIIIENCLISCTLWVSFEKFALTENMRTNSGEIKFNHFLLNIGSGLANTSDTDFIQILREMLCHGDLIERIYGPDIANLFRARFEKQCDTVSQKLTLLGN